MKKRISAIVLCALLLVTLTGCLGDGSVENPKVMSDGAKWDGSWTPMGGYMGAEQPEGFLLLTTNGDIKGMEMCYATWIAGSETELEDGNFVYDCQLYLMTEQCGTDEVALDTIALWREQIGGDLAVTEEREICAGGVDFTLVFYECRGGETHFDRGVTALGIRDGVAIVADLGKVDPFVLDLAAAMEDFLMGLHYA